jgi:hypothetical protein
MEEESDKEAVCHRFYCIYTANTSPRKFLKGLETSKDDGTYVIPTVKYADGLVLPAKEENGATGHDSSTS